MNKNNLRIWKDQSSQRAQRRTPNQACHRVHSSAPRLINLSEAFPFHQITAFRDYSAIFNNNIVVDILIFHL